MFRISQLRLFRCRCVRILRPNAFTLDAHLLSGLDLTDGKRPLASVIDRSCPTVPVRAYVSIHDSQQALFVDWNAISVGGRVRMFGARSRLFLAAGLTTTWCTSLSWPTLVWIVIDRWSICRTSYQRRVVGDSVARPASFTYDVQAAVKRKILITIASVACFLLR